MLLERGLWPSKGIRLECEKPKCATCQSFSICNMCIKGRKCDSCKKGANVICVKRLRIIVVIVQNNVYVIHTIFEKKRCQCVTKKYCTRCKEISLQKSCLECEKIPPKCTSEGQYLFEFILNILFFYYTNFLFIQTVVPEKFFLIQPDFLSQNSAIEESIICINGTFTGHKVLFFIPDFIVN